MSKLWLCKTLLFPPYQERHCCFLTITKRDSAWLESHSQFLNGQENIHLLRSYGSHKPRLSRGQSLDPSALCVTMGAEFEKQTSSSLEHQPSTSSTRNLLLNTAWVQIKYWVLNQSKNFNGIQSDSLQGYLPLITVLVGKLQTAFPQEIITTTDSSTATYI